jgi:D-cysteine desulfhydrase
MHLKLPPTISLANLPTKIEKLERLSNQFGGIEIYVKRDDQTGTEFSGNKVRKLEFVVKEALDLGCNYLITCGGIQSNHCRATAAVAAKLGMKSCLVLRGDPDSEIEGNLFLDKMLGAEIVYITADQYSQQRNEIMAKIAQQKEKDGYKPYVIPEGASNGLGAFGYYQTMLEIAEQEKMLKINFDAIVIAVGSGGTYSGLLMAKKVLNHPAIIYGINVGANKSYFEDSILQIFKESCEISGCDLSLSREEIFILDGHVGRGYALSTPEELDFITSLARLEGLVLDNVYTGKAMYGFIDELKKGTFKTAKNILFIHTGGMFELFSQMRFFRFTKEF